MPITKVPLVHKFGIISLSEAERIIRHQRLEKIKTKRKPFINKSTSCPVITVGFITKYNSCSEIERGKLNGVLKRVLEHAKYKSCYSVSNCGSTDRTTGTDPASRGVQVRNGTGGGDKGGAIAEAVDVSEGWLELIMICQCCGPVQEESLMSLCDSLSSCVVSPSHIPALFYISGLCYYWLKTEIAPSILRSGEILLLKVLHKACLRLYLHHMTGDLQGMCSPIEIQQLKFDMDGFEQCENTYRRFPEALLHWRVAIEVGNLICDKYSEPRLSSTVLSVVMEDEHEVTSNIGNRGIGNRGDKTPLTPTTGNITKSSSNITSTSGGGGSNDGHSLAPILWHALDVWQCDLQEPSALPDAIQDLFSCDISFKTQHWLEGLLAIEILCEAARSNETILHLVQLLAAGSSKLSAIINRPSTSQSNQSHLSSTKAPSLSQYKSDDDICSETTGSKAGTVSELSNDHQVYPNMVATHRTSDVKKVTTLNVLGMQPTFMNPEDGQSEYASYVAGECTEEEEEEEDEEEDDDESNGEDASSTRRLYRGLSSAMSVTTQALLDMESIPDTPLTTHSSVDNASIPNLSALDSDLSEMKVVSMGTTGELSTTGDFDSHEISMAKDSSGLVDISEEGNDLEKRQPQRKGGKKVTLVSLPQTPIFTPPVSDVFDQFSSSDDHENSAIDRVGLLHNRFELIGVLKHQQQIGGTIGVTEGGAKSVTLKLTSPPQRPDSRCTHYTHSTAPFSWIGGGVLGSQAAPSTVYQHSILSLSQSIGSDAPESSRISEKTSSYCFRTWPMEIQLTYVLSMAGLVINGGESNVQRMALLGPIDDSIAAEYSLVSLSGYENLAESARKSQVGSEAWCVRHCAILGLCRVHWFCRDLPTQDGMSEIAWNIVQKREPVEMEPRVLEALKLHQSYPFKSHQTSQCSPRKLSGAQTQSPSVFSYMAEKLANLYLPEINTSVLTHIINKPIAKKPDETLVKKHREVFDKTKIKAKVETQRNELTSHSASKPQSYVQKTSAALNHIATKHWELQMRLEDEEYEVEQLQKNHGK